MASRSQRLRTTALPYRHFPDGLGFALEDYSKDGSKPVELDLKAGQNTIDIAPGSPGNPASEGESWDSVLLYGRLTVSDEMVEALFPPEEREAPPAKLYVAVRCHQTIYRDSIVIQEAPTIAGEYEAKIRLNWSDFRGRVEIKPYLVRTAERESAEGDNYASARNEKLASGQRFEIIVDHRESDAPSMIDGEEASFSQTRHLPDGDEMYYLDFRSEARPKLWINADNPRIADVLRSEGSVGAQPRMRDVILDQVSYAVWTQLIVQAATSIQPDGTVDYEWQETIIEAFGPALYESEDVEAAKQTLFEEVSEPEGVARLIGRVDSELQGYIEPREQLINLMEEGLRI